MEEVTTTGMWPYTPTVKLFSHWPSGEVTTCSGMLVQALTLVTAGQCVYTHQADLCPAGEDSCWVDDLETVPAYADGEDPFGKSGYETILTWTAWTEAENSAYDLAAVQLRYPIGASLGWLGVGFAADDSFFLNNDFSSTSYPLAAPFNGETMAEWTGHFSGVQADLLNLNTTGDSGQVGAGFYGDDGIVYGILSNPDAGGETAITRITYEKFAAIREFIELGLPKAELDLAVFDVHAGPLWNFPGQFLNHLDFYAQNHSETDLPFDTYTFNVYLSPNAMISEIEDTFLGSVTFTGEIPANSGMRLSFTTEAGLALPSVIHGDQPNGGTFYIGVVSNLDEDANDLNNRTDYYQPEPVWVNDSDNYNISFPIVVID
jgi:V8-like Glu-specific endopeptidase